MRWLVALAIVAGCRLNFDRVAGDGATDAIDVGYFISPNGDDTNPGTRALPWRTFGFALPRLVPGDVLNLLDGDYDYAAVGRLAINCTAGAANGTATAPIVVRADHARRARLFGNATPLDIQNCAYWTFDGLWIEALDDPSALLRGGGAIIYYDDHVVARNLLLVGANRYANSHALVIEHSTNTLVEDSEAYDFFRDAFTIYDSSNTTLRRLYGHGRGVLDLTNGYPSECPGADHGVVAYYTFASVIEDVIVEGTCDSAFVNITGRDISGGDTGVGDNVRFVGDIALDPGNVGFWIISDCDANMPCASPDRIASGNMISHSVAVGRLNYGFTLYGIDNQIANVTVHDALSSGIRLDVATPIDPGLAATAMVTSSLVVGSPNGVIATNQIDWTFDRTNVFASGTPFSPNDFHVTNPTQLDPQLGGCLVYLPSGSPMRGIGANGGNIGADLRTLFFDGAATTEPYWRNDGTFAGCGAVVPGVNDDPAAACIGVHTRLHVGSSGCAWP